jgi:hypothetical protein
MAAGARTEDGGSGNEVAVLQHAQLSHSLFALNHRLMRTTLITSLSTCQTNTLFLITPYFETHFL